MCLKQFAVIISRDNFREASSIYNVEQITVKLRRWEKYIDGFALPSWDELPDFELYMDQVLSLVSRFLDLFPHTEGSDPIITPSTINNYVRMKIMPAPVKKKYTRIHLAYLLIICTLKQNLSISVVSRIIPMNISEDEVRTIYDDFVMRHRKLCRVCSDRLGELAEIASDPAREGEQVVEHIVMESAIYSHLYKLLTEKIVALSIEPETEDK